MRKLKAWIHSNANTYNIFKVSAICRMFWIRIHTGVKWCAPNTLVRDRLAPARKPERFRSARNRSHSSMFHTNSGPPTASRREHSSSCAPHPEGTRSEAPHSRFEAQSPTPVPPPPRPPGEAARALARTPLCCVSHNSRCCWGDSGYILHAVRAVVWFGERKPKPLTKVEINLRADASGLYCTSAR